jgi:hypothetical protein
VVVHRPVAPSLVLVLALGWFLAAEARGQPAKKAPQDGPEELGKLVAERIQRATGVRVKIRKLVYELLTSTFVGEGIEAGPKRDPHLTIPKLKVELVLLAKGPGRTVALVEVRRPRARLLPAWLQRLYRYPVHQPVTVRVARLVDGRVTVPLSRDAAIVFSGVQVTVKGLKVPVTKAGAAPALTGELSIKAARVALGERTLGALALEGTLAADHLDLRRLTLGLPGGELSLTGRIGFGDNKRGLGPIVLSGSFAVRDPEIKGTVRLSGRSLRRLTARGRLEGGKGLSRRGGVKGAPPLDLRMRIGARKLQGTLDSWRLR